MRVAQASDWDLVGDLIDEPGEAPPKRVALKVIGGAQETRWQ